MSRQCGYRGKEYDGYGKYEGPPPYSNKHRYFRKEFNTSVPFCLEYDIEKLVVALRNCPAEHQI
jgi:hypothetical protein